MSWDARARELLDELKNKPVTDEERKRLTDGLNAYFSERDKCFDELLAILREESKTVKQQDRWRERLEDCQRTLNSTFGNALSGINPTTLDAFTFRSVRTDEESRFLQALLETKTGEARDQIVNLRGGLNSETVDLDVKWRSILYQNDNFLNAEKQEAAAINAALDDVAKQVAVNDAEFHQLLAALASPSSKWASLLDFVNGLLRSDVLKRVQDAAAQLKIWDTTFKGHVALYQQLARQMRETTLNMLNDVRRDVDRFLRDNSYDVARRVFDAAAGALSSFASSGRASSAQSADASAFRDAALAVLNGHLDKLKSAFNDFVSRYQGTFFGPMTDARRRELLDQPYFDNATHAISSNSVWSALQEEARQRDDLWKTDFALLSDEQRAALREKLTDPLTEYVEAVKRLAEEQSAILEGFNRDELNRMIP